MRESPCVTPREKEVLSCIASGLGCKATARDLNISEYTVRKHRASLLRKLGFSTATELLVYALNQNPFREIDAHVHGCFSSQRANAA